MVKFMGQEENTELREKMEDLEETITQEQERKNPKKRKPREAKLQVMPNEAKAPKQLKKEMRKQKKLT